MTDSLTVLNDRVFTIEDYMKLEDGNQYELIGGKLIMVPAPRTIHQEITLAIASIIREYVSKNNLGKVFIAPTDVFLSETEKPQPDIFFISKERLNIITDMNIQGAPDLVIEVLSPSTAIRDRKDKSKIYLANGVKEFWLVDPDLQLVEMLMASDNAWILAGVFDQEDILTSALLTGLELNLGEVFGGR